MSIMSFVGLDMLMGLDTPKLIVPTEFKVFDFSQNSFFKNIYILSLQRIIILLTRALNEPNSPQAARAILKLILMSALVMWKSPIMTLLS